MSGIAEIIFLDMPCIWMAFDPYEAIICPSMGSNCLRLTVPSRGASLLRTPDSYNAYMQNPNVYGIPLLFPPNRIEDGKYTVNSRQYVFPINEPARNNHIHGFLSRSPFEVIHKEVTDSGVVVTLLYSATREKPYLQFPHTFTMAIQYILSADGLEHRVTVENTSLSPMTFGLGLHTTFCAPFLPHTSPQALRLHVPSSTEWMLGERVTPTGHRESTELQQALHAGTLVPSQHTLSLLLTRQDAPIMLMDLDASLAVEYALGRQYPFVMVYNANRSHSFVCCEPQSWIINAPNVALPARDTGVLSLAPGDSRVYDSRISLRML